MTENRGIMSSFTSASYFDSVILSDGSRTPIQDIDTAAITPTFSLLSVFYLHYFSFNLLSVSKITKILNCTVIFYPMHCIFQELGMRKTFGTGCEQNKTA